MRDRAEGRAGRRCAELPASVEKDARSALDRKGSSCRGSVRGGEGQVRRQQDEAAGHARRPPVHHAELLRLLAVQSLTIEVNPATSDRPSSSSPARRQPLPLIQLDPDRRPQMSLLEFPPRSRRRKSEAVSCGRRTRPARRRGGETERGRSTHAVAKKEDTGRHGELSAVVLELCSLARERKAEVGAKDEADRRKPTAPLLSPPRPLQQDYRARCTLHWQITSRPVRSRLAPARAAVADLFPLLLLHPPDSPTQPASRS